MSEQPGSAETPEIGEHLEMLGITRKMSLSRDAEVRRDALEAISHHGAEISPEVVLTLEIWLQLLGDSDRDTALDARGELFHANAENRIPDEIVELLDRAVNPDPR